MKNQYKNLGSWLWIFFLTPCAIVDVYFINDYIKSGDTGRIWLPISALVLCIVAIIMNAFTIVLNSNDD